MKNESAQYHRKNSINLQFREAVKIAFILISIFYLLQAFFLRSNMIFGMLLIVLN